MLLTFDCQEQNKTNLTSIRGPTWESVEEAICRLDQATYTEVTLESEGQGYIGIGGGCDSYFVYVFTDDERSLILNSGDCSGPSSIALVSGGQSISVPTRRVVSLKQALEACRHYFETSRISDDQAWEEE